MSDQAFEIGDKVVVQRIGRETRTGRVLAVEWTENLGWCYSVSSGTAGAFVPIPIRESDLIRLQQVAAQDVASHAMGEVNLTEQF